MKDRLVSHIARFVDNERLVTPGDTIIVGVSGGPDSVALLHLLNEIAGSLSAALVVAHVNYRLRGRASDDDEAFVRAYAKQLGLPCRVKHVGRETLDVGRKNKAVTSYVQRLTSHGNLQEWARNLRYDFFVKTARKFGGSVVAVAHHQEDQCETVLMNIIRGAGPAGLCGMMPRRELEDGLSLIRPLLCVSRAEIEQYLERNKITCRRDATNDSDKFQRNRVRRRLVPLLARLNDKAVAHICELAAAMREEMRRTQIVADDAAAKCVLEKTAGTVTLCRDGLRSLDSPTRRQVLRSAYGELKGNTSGLSRDHLEQMDKITMGSGMEYSLPGAIKFRRDGNKTILMRL